MGSVIDESIAMSYVENNLEGEMTRMVNSSSGTRNGDVPAPAAFTLVVDNAIRSSSCLAPNQGASLVRNFDSVVNDAIRSSSGGVDIDVPAPAAFTSVMDRAIWSSSCLAPNQGASLVGTFHSVVNDVIRSSNVGAAEWKMLKLPVPQNERHGADSVTYPAYGFASTVDNAIKSEIVLNLSAYGFQSFPLAELVAATNNFSLHNQIGAGSFGSVYRGRLGGCGVAITRGKTSFNKMKFQLMLHLYFMSSTSILCHKNLLGIIGFCCEKDEKLLVFEYMKNGFLYDHLHDKGSSLLNSWRMRIKIALDASRGIECHHNRAANAASSIILRDIKSSNILLDATWTAKVSDFGLSLMSPNSDRDYRPMKAAGTVGYFDPEYYDLNVLTAKSDVYGLGVVLLELLTGKRAIFKYGDDGGTPLSVVDFAVPAILGGELVKILDPRVGPPDVNEVKAVEIMAYTAIDCVNLKGKDRLNMVNIVVNLEGALAICDNSNDKGLAICDNSHGSC